MASMEARLTLEGAESSVKHHRTDVVMDDLNIVVSVLVEVFDDVRRIVNKIIIFGMSPFNWRWNEHKNFEPKRASSFSN